MRYNKKKELKAINEDEVFASFFENFDLQEAKQILHEAKTMMVEKKFGKNAPYSIAKDDFEFFFDKMEQLLESAWVIRGSC